MEQITKDQHIIPKFYLKKFTNNKGLLCVLDTENKSILKPKPYAGVCYEKFYFAQKTGRKDEVSQKLEKAFQQVESHIAKKYNSICQKILNHESLNENDLYVLSSFMSMLWCRSKYMRTNVNVGVSKFTVDAFSMMARHKKYPEYLKRIFKEMGKPVSDKKIEELRDFIINKKYTVDYGNWFHLAMMRDMPEYANWFRIKKWRFHIARGEQKFITSDTPVIEEFNPAKTLVEQMYSNHIAQRHHYFALTPEILVELSDPLAKGKAVKRKWIYDADVLKLNLKIASLSYKYCYSKSNLEFERVIEFANFIKNNFKSVRVHDLNHLG